MTQYQTLLMLEKCFKAFVYKDSEHLLNRIDELFVLEQFFYIHK